VGILGDAILEFTTSHKISVKFLVVFGQDLHNVRVGLDRASVLADGDVSGGTKSREDDCKGGDGKESGAHVE
jgi:hypothetical protein